ncbi:MAG: spermidine/putrescine ABC transporter substrate-binding protein [Deltaproteobacteria bacterium]|nr:spermidine/putrescine ABC transporter substrate-binding protein [Deltaproteobacteria bacterium]
MRRILILSALFTLAVSACTKKTDSQTAPAAATAPRVLHLYCWSNYFSPRFLSEFEKKSGAKIDLNYFSSNEELLAKLQAGARGYDLIVPTGYLIRALKSLGLIEPLGKLDWPELANLVGMAKAPQHDPTREFAIPYSSGTTGLAVNRAKVKAKVDSLAWVFEHPELKGQVGMLDDAPVVIGTALRYLGYHYNDASDEALAKAKALLVKQKKFLKTYTADPMPIMEAGEIAVTQAYSGDVLQVRRKNPNLEFVHPKEGGEFFMDYLAIPKGAASPELAKEFMRFSLDRGIAAVQVMHLFYSPVVDIKGLPGTESLISNKVIFPGEETLKKFEILEDNPERLEKLQRIWTELKSS